jgi:hypothetical protein
MARRKRGAIVVGKPEWDITKMMGGALLLGGSAGQLGHNEVYNDSSSGSYLYIYSVTPAAGTISQFTIEWYKGQKATVVGAFPFDYGPLVVGGPQLSGIFGAFYSPSCVGNHIGQAASPSGGYSWTPGYPIAVIAPGYSFCLECQTAGQAVVCGINWMVDGSPW